jgi:type I restriction enzyme R subunit
MIYKNPDNDPKCPWRPDNAEEGGTGIPACPADGAVNQIGTDKNVCPTVLSAFRMLPDYFVPDTGAYSRDFAEYETTRRHLPHWRGSNALYWVTFHTADAIPQEKLRLWREELDRWLAKHPKPWPEADFAEYDANFGERFEKWLDAGAGSCPLAPADAREAVRQCLLRFNGERVNVRHAVIMPNHVHALLEPLAGNELSALLKGMKGASARAVNKLTGEAGQFWFEESYDHIVRSAAQFWRLVRYIENNPEKARLRETQYWLMSAKDEGRTGNSCPYAPSQAIYD